MLMVLLQGELKAARQQLAHMSASFDSIYSKFQHRFQSEKLEAASAARADASVKLKAQLQAAQQECCQQKSLAQAAEQLLHEGQQRVHTLRLAITGTLFLCITSCVSSWHCWCPTLML